MRTAPLALVVLAGLLLVGCHPKPTGTLHETLGPDYDRPLPPGALALRKITDPAQIPDFTAACESTFGLREGIARSLSYLAKPSSQGAFPYGEITHAHAVESLRAFDALLGSDLSPADMNRAIRERFDVYISVGCDDRGTVLFTGYYTPVFEGSPVATERFSQPLYRMPPNLVKDDQGRVLGLRQADGSLAPCPDRRGLRQSGLLEGLELVWLADAVEAYICQVQGSAVLRGPDGRYIPVGYAATSGHDYVSIGREMVKDGHIASDALSLQSILAWFRANPGQIDTYLDRNPRFVFFGPTDDVTPRGSLNEPVTAWRTIATDKEVYPRACLAMLAAPLPRKLADGVRVIPHRMFVLDQDAGGAIRAPGRCDIYMGIGETAGDLAGRTRQEGRLYYLFLKPGQSAPAPLAGR